MHNNTPSACLLHGARVAAVRHRPGLVVLHVAARPGEVDPAHHAAGAVLSLGIDDLSSHHAACHQQPYRYRNAIAQLCTAQ